MVAAVSWRIVSFWYAEMVLKIREMRPEAEAEICSSTDRISRVWSSTSER